jgi:hypothetical protein
LLANPDISVADVADPIAVSPRDGTDISPVAKAADSPSP